MSGCTPVFAPALRGTFAALCGSLLAPMAIAADPGHEGHEQTLPELSPTVITAIAPSSPLTVVTNPKDPRQPVPASDGADYLKTIPGFSAIRAGGTNGDPVLRGMFGSRLNILTNGGVMLGACPNRMDAPTSYIAPETYDRLTVIKGPQSVIWGPGGSAGTILFEREPEKFGTLGSRVNASLLAGSNGRFDKVLDAAAGNSQAYARFVGNQSRSDDYHDGNGDTVPSRWDKWNGDVTLGWTPALNFAAMGRMHNPGKGISRSSRPYTRAAPTWIKADAEALKEEICKFARKGMTPSQIGVTLRDSHGVPLVQSITGAKILRVLKKAGLAAELPEDLYHLIKKAVNMRRHLERNRKDKDSKFRLILVESRIHRLARYYKTKKTLQPNWKYESATASALVA